VVDIDWSPDSEWLAYSSWSTRLSLFRADGSKYVSRELDEYSHRRICIFSVRFSQQGTELVGASSDHCLYVCNIETGAVQRVYAHDDDVNSVCFVEHDGNVLLSGSDDALVKLWDRRMLSSDADSSSAPAEPLRNRCPARGSSRSGMQKPVGILEGHMYGVTRLVLSNSKDQTAKLFDLRMCRSELQTLHSQDSQEFQNDMRRHRWDYRWEPYEQSACRMGKHPNDRSLRTFRGHKVAQTLVRAYFTPPSMGAAHVVCGSFDGAAHIYDITTGECVRKLAGHSNTVRDISMHPFENTLATSSWDGRVLLWDYQPELLTC